MKTVAEYEALLAIANERIKQLEQRLLLSSEAEKGEKEEDYSDQCVMAFADMPVKRKLDAIAHSPEITKALRLLHALFRDVQAKNYLRFEVLINEERFIYCFAKEGYEETPLPSPPTAQEKQGAEVSSKIDAKRLLEILLQYEAKMNEEIISLVKQNQ